MQLRGGSGEVQLNLSIRLSWATVAPQRRQTPACLSDAKRQRLAHGRSRLGGSLSFQVLGNLRGPPNTPQVSIGALQH